MTFIHLGWNHQRKAFWNMLVAKLKAKWMNYKRNAYTKADLQCTNAYTKEVESCLPSDANINNVAK
uniref:Uncharacterized protein n=1 Tax=Cucumis melo TaxID=3656 RepID=A0A9I9EG23_CUCME